MRSAPPRHDVVLIGGGHSHVQVLRRQLMNPLPQARVTVVLDRAVAVYSGMVPGLVAGQYRPRELEIDVRSLARRVGARVMVAPVLGIDPVARQITLAGRAPLAYDVASINVGSTVRTVSGVREYALPTRPIAGLVARIDSAVARLPKGPRIVVVGAGAGGVELAFCLHSRLRDLEHPPRITLLCAQERPLMRRAAKLGKRILVLLAKRGIAVHFGSAVRVESDAVVLKDGESLPSDLTVWVASAEGLPFLRQTGLTCDERGFVWVDDNLSVEGTERLFAVGDCAVLRSWPQIPKAGVYAVRQGPILADNLAHTLNGSPLVTFRPQRAFLTLLNLGDGTALGEKWGLIGHGRPVFAWKDRIDRQFVERFQVLAEDDAPSDRFLVGLSAMNDMDVVCGGCAAKLGESELTRALKRLEPAAVDPTIVLGMAQSDDAVAWKRDNWTVVSNIDGFTGFTDDPWLVGRAAAVNACSDLYAKGAEPRYAQAFVALPDGPDREEALFQVLSGARAAFDPIGIQLLGGHTLVGPQLIVGFEITGFANGPLWRNSELRPGDALVLTRGLGTGVLWHADMSGQARGEWMDAVIAGMLRGNRDAAGCARGLDVSAVTDISGFGLVGHLAEVLRASGCSAQIDARSVPALPGALTRLRAGERSTFHAQNREAIRAIRVRGEGPRLELLFDPQTCGGLLIGIDPAQVDALLFRLRNANEDEAARIGTVTRPTDALLTVDVG